MLKIYLGSLYDKLAIYGYLVLRLVIFHMVLK